MKRAAEIGGRRDPRFAAVRDASAPNFADRGKTVVPVSPAKRSPGHAAIGVARACGTA